MSLPVSVDSQNTLFNFIRKPLFHDSLNGGRSCEAVIGLLVHSRSAFLNGHAVYKLNQELDLSLFKQKHTRTHIQWQS